MHQFNNKQSRNSELKKGFIFLDYYISYPPVERDEESVDKDYKKISDKIVYLLLCFNSIENKKNKVKELWQLIIKYFNNKNIDSLPSKYSLIINYIYSFSIESKLDIDEISKYEILLHDYILIL